MFLFRKKGNGDEEKEDEKDINYVSLSLSRWLALDSFENGYRALFFL